MHDTTTIICTVQAVDLFLVGDFQKHKTSPIRPQRKPIDLMDYRFALSNVATLGYLKYMYIKVGFHLVGVSQCTFRYASKGAVSSRGPYRVVRGKFRPKASFDHKGLVDQPT
jgi:hypothetical protein